MQLGRSTLEQEEKYNDTSKTGKYGFIYYGEKYNKSGATLILANSRKGLPVKKQKALFVASN